MLLILFIKDYFVNLWIKKMLKITWFWLFFLVQPSNRIIENLSLVLFIILVLNLHLCCIKRFRVLGRHQMNWTPCFLCQNKVLFKWKTEKNSIYKIMLEQMFGCLICVFRGSCSSFHLPRQYKVHKSNITSVKAAWLLRAVCWHDTAM